MRGQGLRGGGVRISEVMVSVIFLKKIMKKMTQKTANVTLPEVHLSDDLFWGPELHWVHSSEICRSLNK